MAVRIDKQTSPTVPVTRTKSQEFAIHQWVTRLGSNDRERYYHDLGELLSAGVDTRNALDTIAGAYAGGKVGVLSSRVRDELIRGASLFEAMRLQTEFSAIEVFSVRVGEESGSLARIVSELHLHFKHQNQLRRKVVSALTYPAFVLFISIGVIVFMLTTVVPMFAGVFARFGKELPPLTRAVVRLSENAGYIVPFFLVVVLSILFLGIIRKRNNTVDLLLTRISYRIPFMGPLLRAGHAARTCRSMAMLLSADVPLTEALALTADLAGSQVFRNALERTATEVIRGMPLHKALSETGALDRPALAMLKVGEEVNRLDDVFLRLSEKYHDVVEVRASALTSVMEPALIVLISVFVGVILVAMYLPMFKLSTTLN